MLKKILIIQVVLIFAVGTSFAQVYWAPKAGINGIGTFNKADGLDLGYNSGFQGGLEIGVKALGIAGFRMEALYSNRKFNQTRSVLGLVSEVSSDPQIYQENVQIKNGSFDLAAHFVLHLGKKFEFVVGPEVTFLTKAIATGNISQSGEEVKTIAYDYLQDEFNEGVYAFQQALASDGQFFEEVNLNLNIGFNFALINRLYIDVRTNYGMTDLINDVYLEGTESPRNFDFIINASYRIYSKKKSAKM